MPTDDLIAELQAAYVASVFRETLFQRAAETIRALEKELDALRRDVDGTSSAQRS